MGLRMILSKQAKITGPTRARPICAHKRSSVFTNAATDRPTKRTDRQTNKQTERPTDRKTDRQTDRHATNRQTTD